MSPNEAYFLIQNDLLPSDRRVTHWADLGCGTGLFTQALSRLLTSGSTIHGIDTRSSLKRQTTPNGIELIPLQLDFVTDDWQLTQLDGILMANSLHYVRDQIDFLSHIKTFVQPNASFLIVEYDTDIAVPTWVPYPLSFSSLQRLFTRAGYTSIQKLGEKPSIYGGGNIYAALVRT